MEWFPGPHVHVPVACVDVREDGLPEVIWSHFWWRKVVGVWDQVEPVALPLGPFSIDVPSVGGHELQKVEVEDQVPPEVPGVNNVGHHLVPHGGAQVPPVGVPSGDGILKPLWEDDAPVQVANVAGDLELPHGDGEHEVSPPLWEAPGPVVEVPE